MLMHSHSILFFTFCWYIALEVSACQAVDVSLIPGPDRFPGGGNVNSLQCSCLENSMVGYSPLGLQRVRHKLATKQQTTVKQKWGTDGGREIKDDNNHISELMRGSRECLKLEE